MASCKRVIIFSIEILLLLFNFFSIGSCDKVPVFIWGRNSHPNSLPSTSALGSVSLKNFKEDYLKYLIEERPLVAFVQDALSLEDVNRKPSAYPNLENDLDKNPSIVLTSVENPEQALKSLKSQTIQSSDVNSESLNKLFKDKPEALLILLPPTLGAADRRQALLKNDEILEEISKLLDPLSNLMFTGKTSSWDSSAEHEAHHRVARQLQSTAEESNVTNPNFLNVSKALYWYGENIAIRAEDHDFNATYNPPTVVQTTNITNTSMNVHLQFERSDNPTIKVQLNLDIETTFNHWWYVSKSSIQLGNQDPIAMRMSDIGASAGFSYSCGMTTLKALSSNFSSNFTLDINHFQLEFMPKRNKFSESFSCSTFFTIPIWMGLFVVILFTMILAFGVYLLFELKTMDRFDDPKGKSITVPQAD